MYGLKVAYTLLSLYKQVLDPALRGSLTNVNRWFTTAINQPNPKSVLREVALCMKTDKFGTGDKNKEEKAKAEPAKKKEPDKKKKEQAEPLEYNSTPAEPIKSNPMDASPKGNLDIKELLFI